MEKEYERPEIIYEGELEVWAGTPKPKLPGLPDLDGEVATDD